MKALHPNLQSNSWNLTFPKCFPFFSGVLDLYFGLWWLSCFSDFSFDETFLVRFEAEKFPKICLLKFVSVCFSHKMDVMHRCNGTTENFVLSIGHHFVIIVKYQLKLGLIVCDDGSDQNKTASQSVFQLYKTILGDCCTNIITKV